MPTFKAVALAALACLAATDKCIVNAEEDEVIELRTGAISLGSQCSSSGYQLKAGEYECIGEGEGICNGKWQFGIEHGGGAILLYKDMRWTRIELDLPGGTPSLMAIIENAQQLCIGEDHYNLPYLHVQKDKDCAARLVCKGEDVAPPRLKIPDEASEISPHDFYPYGRTVVKFRDAPGDENAMMIITNKGNIQVVDQYCSWHVFCDTDPTPAPSPAPTTPDPTPAPSPAPTTPDPTPAPSPAPATPCLSRECTNLDPFYYNVQTQRGTSAHMIDRSIAVPPTTANCIADGSDDDTWCMSDTYARSSEIFSNVSLANDTKVGTMYFTSKTVDIIDLDPRGINANDTVLYRLDGMIRLNGGFISYTGTDQLYPLVDDESFIAKQYFITGGSGAYAGAKGFMTEGIGVYNAVTVPKYEVTYCTCNNS